MAAGTATYLGVSSAVTVVLAIRRRAGRQVAAAVVGSVSAERASSSTTAAAEVHGARAAAAVGSAAASGTSGAHSRSHGLNVGVPRTPPSGHGSSMSGVGSPVPPFPPSPPGRPPVPPKTPRPPRAMHVLVYSGPGVSAAEAGVVLADLRAHVDDTMHLVSLVTAEELQRDDWVPHTAAVVLPHGADAAYADKFPQPAATILLGFVQAGGKVMGVGRGAAVAERLLLAGSRDHCVHIEDTDRTELQDVIVEGAGGNTWVSKDGVHGYLHASESYDVVATGLNPSVALASERHVDRGAVILSTVAVPQTVHHDGDAPGSFLVAALGLAPGNKHSTVPSPSSGIIWFSDQPTKSAWLQALAARGQPVSGGGYLVSETTRPGLIVYPRQPDASARAGAQNAAPAGTLVAIVKDTLVSSPAWELEEFSAKLRTRVLGRTTMYFDIITSTQTALDANFPLVQTMPQNAGLAVIAHQQIAGRGRATNQWLSPPGSVAMTLLSTVSQTNLPRITFLQYLVPLAVVEAVNDLVGPDHQLNLKIKWPNDVLLVKPDGSMHKVCGVLVSSSHLAPNVHLYIGFGINVENPAPSVSLNAALADVGLPRLTVPAVAAAVLNRLEPLMASLFKTGFAAVSDRYHGQWLHSDAKVHVDVGGGETKPATIQRVDPETGALRALGEDGTVHLLYPGDSRFDMISQLVSRR